MSFKQVILPNISLNDDSFDCLRYSIGYGIIGGTRSVETENIIFKHSKDITDKVVVIEQPLLPANTDEAKRGRG